MRIPLLLAVLLVSAIGPVFAEPVRVVTRNIEPFSFEQNQRRVGFAIELWERVAQELGLQSEYILADSANAMVADVRNKTADVAVGALSITASREKVIDFSQPFYESGLQIVVPGKEAGLLDLIQAYLGNVLTLKVLGCFLLAILVMLVISHLVWMHEHPINEEMWPRSYLAGMWESFWWTLSIFLVGGADNKGPVGLGGRLVAIVWMIVSVISVSLLTASLTTAFVVNSLAGDIRGPKDLPKRKVATIAGSAAETWLANNGAVVKPAPGLQECFDALARGSVDAVVYDAPILKYYLKKPENEKFTLVGELFDRNNYGFALQDNSPLRERVNGALLTLSENGVTTKLRKDWFGDGEEPGAVTPP